MKKLFLFATLLSLSQFIFGQITISVDIPSKVTNSQSFGLEVYEGDYKLTVMYDDSSIKFNTREGQTMDMYSITKKTDKYVVGSNTSGNYSFLDIKSQQFFYIDNFRNKYTIAGYGEKTNEIKKTVTKMMELLTTGNTQKDVIQHLIGQTEYDI